MSSNELINAILSMDSYNRGYNASLDLRPRSGNGELILDVNGNSIPSDRADTQIGTATISQNSSLHVWRCVLIRVSSRA
jgi:hypothetical protein